MAVKGASVEEKQPVQLSRAEGIDYLYEFFGISDYWDVTDLTIEKINKFKENVYAQKIASNLTNMIFQGSPIINVLDEQGNSQEDVAEWYRTMLSSELVDFEEMLHRTVDAWMYYGTFIHSDTVSQVGDRILLTEIRDLPPETFANSGYLTTGGFVPFDIIAHGKLLKGIMRYQDGSVHYWQTQLQQVIELTNCQHIRAPKYGYYIDGVPLLAPLYKCIPKMNASWDSLMQSLGRSNALFLRVNRVSTMPDNQTSNWNYCNKVLSSYNKNVFFTLPPEVEPIELHGPVSDIAVVTIDLLTKLMISLYSASDFISKGDGNLIGGSNAGETNLFKNTIIGIQTKLLKAWTPLLNKILEWNGYAGYTVEITLPEPKFKNEQLDFAKGQEIIKAVKEGHIVGSVNEVRTLFDLEDASPEFLAKAMKEWEDLKVELAAPAMIGQNMGAPDSQKPNSDKNAQIQKKGGESNGKEKSESKLNQVKAGQEQLKQNQGEPESEEEVSEDLLIDLKTDISEFFAEIRKLRGLSA